MKNSKIKRGNHLLKAGALGLAISACISLPAAAETEAQRAETNRKILSCYAIAAQISYAEKDTLHNICSEGNHHGSVFVPADAGEDHRNNMADWVPSSDQSLTYNDVLKFFERTNTLGNRKELLIGLRGSQSAGDWGQDIRAQVFVGSSLWKSAIGSVTAPPNGHWFPRVNAGFYGRSQNLAPDIADKLDELEAWKNADPYNRTIGVKLAGHSLGAATATILSYYVANRYLVSKKADVELFAFNSPIIGNASVAKNINIRANSDIYNIHIINNDNDLVSKIPMPGTSIELLNDARVPGTQFDDPDNEYVKGVRVKNPTTGTLKEKSLKYHEVTQWFYDDDADGYNSQSFLSDAQMVALFPEEPIGTLGFIPLSWDPDFNNFVQSNTATLAGTTPTDAQVLNLQRDLSYVAFDSSRWNHHTLLGGKDEETYHKGVFAGSSNEHLLWMSGLGSLELYKDGVIAWSTNTDGPNRKLVMQADGNLVIYDSNGAVWAAGSWHSGAEHLVLSDDGAVLLLDENGAIVKVVAGPY